MTAPKKPTDTGGIPAKFSSECPRCGDLIERGKTSVVYERGTQICVEHVKAAS